jgi:hypothetical protein
VSATTHSPEVLAIFDAIKALTLPERLRFAADLLDNRAGNLAAPIVRQVADALDMAVVKWEAERAQRTAVNP